MKVLVKFFKTREYANHFIDGNLYCNTIQYFRKIEHLADGRKDEHEGRLPLVGVKSISLDGHVFKVLNRPDKRGYFSYGSIEYLNIFSMSIVEMEVKNKIGDLRIPPEYFSIFGNYLVVITHSPEFLKRIEKSLNELKYKYGYQDVNYYKPDEIISPEYSFEEIIFMKHEKFKYQNEFRIAFDTGSEDDKPITLKIGNITDNAIKLDTTGIRFKDS